MKRPAFHRLPRWIGVGGLLLAAVVVNQSATHWRANVVDDHLFAYYGWCVSQGARPYLDVWDNKPPAIWWLNAAAFRLCGPGVGAELLIGALAMLTTLAAFVATAGRTYHRSLVIPAAAVAAILLTHHEFECGGNRTETYVMACETLAVLGYVRWLHGRRWCWLLLGGLAAGAAPLFKQSGLAGSIAVVLHLAWVQCQARSAGGPRRRFDWRPWAVAAGGFVIAPAVATVALASQGALGEALFAVGRFNRAYFAAGQATWVHVTQPLRIFAPFIEVLTPALLIAAAGLLSGSWKRVRHWQTNHVSTPPRRGVGLFALWFLLALYLACVGPGQRGYHLMPMLPGLGLLLLYPLHQLAARAGLRQRLAASPAATAFVVVWGCVLLTLARGSLAEAARAWDTKPHWYALARTRPAAYEAQAVEVARLTRPDETIYVCGWSPGTYRYAYRRPASRFATLEKLGQVGEYARFMEDGARADLYRRPPKVLVISTREYPGLMTPPLSEFAAWVQRHYVLHCDIQGMNILIRRE